MNYSYNREDILRYIESRGFSVKQDKKIYHKRDNVGYINWNDTNMYFFKKIPAPFTDNTILFSQVESYEVVSDSNFTPFVEKPVVYGEFSSEFYRSNTSLSHQLDGFFTRIAQDGMEDAKTYNKDYALRGILSGSYEGCVVFPYMNIEGDFVHGKVARYEPKTGRRVKGKGCNIHAFHAMEQHWSKAGYEEQPTKPKSCFFGEHLLKGRPNTPVIIVESEKTAVQMSLIFADCDVVFLAVGGLTMLKNTPIDNIKNRRVMLQPDNGASSWRDIADERGYKLGTIIEYFGENKTDIGDYFEEGADDDIREEIRKEILHFIFVEGGEPEYLKGADSFGFEMKDIKGAELKAKFNLDTKALKDFSIIYSHAYDGVLLGLEYYLGKHFLVYPEMFSAVTANTDFNKSVLDEENVTLGNGWRVPRADEFLKRLEKTFVVIYALNIREGVEPELIKKVYRDELMKIQLSSQFTFSVEHVMNKEVVAWEKGMKTINGVDYADKRLQAYYNDRDWVVKRKKKGARPLTNFNEMKNVDRRFANVWHSLKAIHESITENKYKFLDKTTIGDKERRTVSNPLAYSFIDKYNREYLGVNSADVMAQKMAIYDSVMNIANKGLSAEVGGDYLNCSPIGFDNTKEVDKANNVRQPTAEQLRDMTGRESKERAAKSYKTHKPSFTTKSFLERLEHIIENVRHVDFERIVDDDSVRYEVYNLDRILNVNTDINLKELKRCKKQESK